MRKLVVLIPVLIAAGLSAWWFSFDSDEARARLEAEAARKASTAALGQMLDGHPAFEFRDVVVGTSPSTGRRDFRALVERNGALRPAYGEAEYACPDVSANPGCWRLARLDVDGVAIPMGLAGARMPAPAAPATDATGSDAPAPPEGSASTEPEIPSPQPRPVLEEVASATQAEPAPSATDAANPGALAAAPAAAQGEAEPDAATGARSRTHRVVVSLANARAGPGTENAIRFTLAQDVDLHMLERDGRWGHFLVLSGDAEGKTAWMAFSTIAEAPAEN
ncbi:hypothetical protein M1105_12995 [Limibaculum sp. FT325]|uniref:hypothetical protein n=1 Tax=Thermohalobaculum sediminis TaxID=2939436 RepID=UPI0020BF1535|nr:hypothetical protein [Limibaculum sediminis]MCL5777899.1 hypothetical protein [Limibaculum sediminis]